MDKISPMVSVVIPAYNQGQYLGLAIKSVLSQTYSQNEIIVVDDGSTDDSREVVSQFGYQVRYIWQENKGLGGARNTGIGAARGEFIGFLDADDHWLPTFLEKMVLLTSRYPEASVYYCCAQGMDTDGNTLPQLFGGPVRQPDMIYQSLLRANFLIPSTIVVRCADIVASGMFDQSSRDIHGCEDWDLWLKLALDHDFIGIDECLVRYRLHGSSLSANPAGMQRAARAVIEKHFGPDDGDYQNWSDEKRRAYGGAYRYCLKSSVQGQQDWSSAAEIMELALKADPTLSVDLTFFYDLALGAQTQGYRGTSFQLDLENNTAHINQLLLEVFDSPFNPKLRPLRRQTYGTAYFALGLVAYNIRQFSLARSFLFRALYFRPELWRDSRIFGNIVKSFVVGIS
jgi:glycosyltransferase involved in cell wall biosynthesis